MLFACSKTLSPPSWSISGACHPPCVKPPPSSSSGPPGVNGQVEVPAGGHEKSPPLDGFSGGGGRGAGSSRSGLFHAVGLAFGGDDDGVVE